MTVLICLAGLAIEPIQAAADSANAWRITRQITVPLLTPTIAAALLR